MYINLKFSWLQQNENYLFFIVHWDLNENHWVVCVGQLKIIVVYSFPFVYFLRCSSK